MSIKDIGKNVSKLIFHIQERKNLEHCLKLYDFCIYDNKSNLKVHAFGIYLLL
jgi:hypothetical protein